MNKLIPFLRQIRSFCLPPTPDYFIKQQNRTYTPDQVLLSLQQMLTGTRFSQERSIKLLLRHLHCVLYYVCNSQAYNRDVEECIECNEASLVASTVEVLRLYREYLRKILPTNSTYFHFLRDSQFYLHYVVVRYLLIVGDSRHLRKVSNVSLYGKITQELKTSIFCLLVEWLYELIEYRNSAIYVDNTTLEYLISSTFILVCGLLGRSYENTFTLLEKPSQKDTFNKLMFITIYMLCDTTSSTKKNKYFLVSMSISCLRKMLVQQDIPDIDIFIPNYLYADMIGFIHCPLTYEIVFRVLISFLNEGFEKELKRKLNEEKKNAMLDGIVEESDLSRSSDNEEPMEDLFFVSPLTEINIWGVINLIVQKYGTYNKTVLQSFLTKIVPTLQPQSIVRAYCIRLIQQLDLVQSNSILKKFYKNCGYDYCFDDKLISVELVIKNFRAFMEAIYSSYVQEAVMEKEVVLTVQNIFKYLVEFNINEIREVPEEVEGGQRHEVEKLLKNNGRQQLRRVQGIDQPCYSSQQSERRKDQGEQQLIVPVQVLSARRNEGKSCEQQDADPQVEESIFYEKRNTVKNNEDHSMQVGDLLLSEAGEDVDKRM